MAENKRFLGISPEGAFSGYEKSFFRAVQKQGWLLTRVEVKLPIFKLFCTAISFYPNKSKWALRRDVRYNTSIIAFKKKSQFAQSQIRKLSERVDFIYQIGTLWNPLPRDYKKPFILTIDYTPKLSEKSEWKRKPGKEADFWNKEVKKIYKDATKICAVTKNAMNSLINDYEVSPEKIEVIGPLISSPYYKCEPNKYPDYNSKRILFVGKGYKGKGLDTLLLAFRKVRSILPDAVLTVVGPSLTIADDGVEYVGRISGELVKDLYYKSTVFAMPSINEPVGQVFLEAMSCKLPCIGTTVDAMPELIENTVTGFTVEPKNEEELAEHLLYLLSDPAKARKMGFAGFNKWQKEFSEVVVGRKIIDAIESVL